MTEQPTASKPAWRANAATVKKLLRPKGATLTEINEVTGWLPHSARAFMTGLRKKSHYRRTSGLRGGR